MEAHSPAHAVRPPVLLACFYGVRVETEAVTRPTAPLRAGCIMSTTNPHDARDNRESLNCCIHSVL